MSLPRVAIVGRPNVGKSSLMNMLAKAKVSIVDPTPGVTRDRVTAMVELTGPERGDVPRLIELTDTGGYGVYTSSGARYDDAQHDLSTLTAQIEAQIGAAVERADLILFVVDAQAGITALDQTVAELLRRRALGKGRAAARRVPIAVVANKVDADKWENHAPEAASLGFGEPLIVSAKTNFRRRDFIERLYRLVPEAGNDAAPEISPEMKIALVGRRNAGKSTFVNALAGEERCIVSEIPGTTRDAIDVRFEMDGRRLMAIDTAGLRKKSRFADAIEHYALQRLVMAIKRADVVLLLMDATEEISAIDKRLGQQVQEEFKPCVVVVTKWDLVHGRVNRKGEIVTVDDYRAYIEREMPGLSYCPIVFTSAAEGRGLKDVINVAFELFEQSRERVPTARLNEVMRAILAHRGPSSKLGTKAKVLYVSQIAVQPPTIVAVVNKPELFGPEYERYLLNRLREELPFEEIPIRLVIRGRRRDHPDDLGDAAPEESRRVAGRGRRGRELARQDAEPMEIDWSEPDGGVNLILPPMMEDATAEGEKPAPPRKPARSAASAAPRSRAGAKVTSKSRARRATPRGRRGR